MLRTAVVADLPIWEFVDHGALLALCSSRGLLVSGQLRHFVLRSLTFAFGAKWTTVGRPPAHL